VDAADVVEAEAYATLNAAALTNQARLFQHVPENTKLEEGAVVIVGDMDSESIATKGGADQSFSLTIVAVVEAEERKPLRAIRATVIELLHEHQVVRDGWQLLFVFTGDDGFLDPETGQAYVGNFRFTVLAFAS
jgi:hypothetical protein